MFGTDWELWAALLVGLLMLLTALMLPKWQNWGAGANYRRRKREAKRLERQANALLRQRAREDRARMRRQKRNNMVYS
jgi:hypothetical protein